MNDERNHLFRDYAAIIKRLKPTGFIFENVMGLLSMENGEVFKLISKQLSDAVSSSTYFIVKSEEFGVPQRRTRVILMGHEHRRFPLANPKRITKLRSSPVLFDDLAPAISVKEALSDLPPLENGEDGSLLDYVSKPSCNYQRLMRGEIDPHEYLSSFS